ncbi:MAG: hypothetical protein AAF941_02140 [Pseudomonadota bacterium]
MLRLYEPDGQAADDNHDHYDLGSPGAVGRALVAPVATRFRVAQRPPEIGTNQNAALPVRVRMP